MSLWPFRRRDKPADSSPPPTAAPSMVPAAAPARPPANEWNLLPPLSRTSGPPPLVAPLSNITTGLAATADTGMVLAPLGHQRRADAPTGLVSGTIVPTTQATARGGRAVGPALDLRRPFIRREPIEAQTLRWPRPSAAAALTEESSPGARPGTPPAEQRRDPERTVGVVPTPAAKPAAATSEARAAALPQAPPSRRLKAAPRVAREPVQAQASPSTSTSPAMPLPASPAPPATEQTTADPSPAGPPLYPTSPQRPAESPSPSGQLTGQRTIHRRRLGEPLAHRPATMVASVSPTSDLPTRAAPVGRDAVATPADARPARVPTTPATRNALPLRHARPMEVVPSTSGPQDTELRHERQPVGQRSVPLVGRRAALATQQPRTEARPAGPSDGAMTVSTTQRHDDGPVVVPISRPRPPTAEPAPSPNPTERVPSDLRAQLEPMLNADLSDVPIHRGAPSARAASEMRARAFTVGSEVHLPDKLGPTSHGEARETLAHELTHVVQQRRLGSVAPDERSAAGEHMETEARQVARRVATPQRVSVAPPAPRRPSVPMVHNPPPKTSSTQPPPQVPTASLSPTEAREMVSHVEGAALSSGMATRMPGGGVAFGGSPSATATSIGAQREPETSSVPATQTNRVMDAPTATNPTDDLTPERVEELASRLYDGIRSRLRHDLLVQRERAGSLFDHR